MTQPSLPGNDSRVHLFVAGCRHNLRHPEGGWFSRITFTVSAGARRWTSIADLHRESPFEFKDVKVTLHGFVPTFCDQEVLAAALRDYFAQHVQGYFWRAGTGSGTVAEEVLCPLRYEAHFRRQSATWSFDGSRVLPLENQLPRTLARLVPIPADPTRLGCSLCLARLQGNPDATYVFEFADRGLGDDQFQLIGNFGDLWRRAVAGEDAGHLLGVPFDAVVLCVSCREWATPGFVPGATLLEAIHEPHRAFSAATGEGVPVPAGSDAEPSGEWT